MKKITLWLFALFGCWQINAQVNLVQNFNGGTVLPAGWTETGGKTIAAAESCEGNSIRDNLYSFSATGTLVSPNQVGASNGTDLTFSFDYKIENWSSTVPTPAGWGNFTVDYSTDNGATWITFFTVNDANHVVANTCATFTNVIPAASLPTGSDFRFRFNMTWASGDYDIYFDNISATQVSTIAPDCTTLITPADGAVNVTSSVISWSVPTGIPDGYYLTVGTTSGGNDILDNFDVGNVTSYNIGALAGSTIYYVTIIPYNSIGDAIGCTETSFSSCFINVAPWTYDVETAAATTNSTIADCWSSSPSGTTAAFRWDVDASGGTPSGTSTGPSGANSGVKYFYTEASSGTTGAVAELYTPLVDLSGLAEPTLQFYYHMHGVNMGALHVDIFDGTTWTNDVLVISGPQQTAASDPWTLSIVSLNAFSGSTIQVRFRGIRGAGFESDMSLDDISFEEAPSCFDPINLGATNITADSFDLLFTDASGGNQFDFNYVVQPQGTGVPATFPAGDYEDGSNTLDGTNYIIPVSGLTPNTTYEIYVAADCNGNWVGPINFTTPCSSYNTFPFTETFEAASSSRTCWTNIQEAGAANWTYATGSSGGLVTTAFEGTLNARFVSTSGSNSPITKLVSPVFDMSALTNPRLKFHYAQEVWFGDQNELKVYYRISSTDPWVEIAHYTANVTAWTEVILTLPNPSATYQIAFEGINNFGRANVVDNVIVEESPSCVEPTALNVSGITASSAILGWTETGSATSWDIEWGTLGFTPTGTPTISGATNPQAISGLSSNTAYSFYVRANCGANGFSTWVGPFNFTTNIEVVCGTPVNTTHCYTNNDATTWTFTSDDASPLRITFNAGGMEACCDEIIIYDGTDATGTILYQGNNGGNLAGLTVDSTTDSIHIVIDADGSVSCGSGSTCCTAQFDFTVTCATCVNPTATFTSVPDCVNSEFSIDVNLTNLGSATSVSISDGTTTLTNISTTGIQTFGPYTDASNVTIVITNEQDGACTINSGNFTYVCPAVNDNLCDAISLTVNAVSTGTQYNNIGATAEPNEPIAGCFSDGINGSVWFSFVAPASGEVIITTDIAGASATDTEIALYDATGVTCSDLSTLGAPIACDQDGGTTIIFNSIITQAGLTPGNTYYIQVDDYGWGTTQGSFGIEVQEVLSSDLFDNNNFTAYPNPVKDILNLSYTSEITSVRVINMLGQVVISRNLNATNAQVDMSQLSAGTYIVNVAIGDTIKTVKVVKQ